MSSARMVPGVPGIPDPNRLWRSAAFWGWLLYAVLVVRAAPHFVVQYWFNQSLGFQTIFWTNLRTQALLFLACGTLAGLALAGPIRALSASPALRRAALSLGVWGGSIAGWALAGRYQQALLALHGVPFGRVDPVFGRDIGFYAYQLPFWEPALLALTLIGLLGVASSVIGRLTGAHGPEGRAMEDSTLLRRLLSRIASPWLLGWVALVGVSVAGRTWLSRYGLLWAANEDSGVRTGAEALDVTGLVSTLNFLTLSVVVELGVTLILCLVLVQALRSRPGQTRALRRPVWAGSALVGLELAFFVALVIRDHVYISPNEPLVQREFIQRHIEATLAGWRLAEVETHEWEPPAAPLETEALLASRTIQNAPFVPSWVSYLEEPPDIQHYQRIELSGSTLVHGPLLQIYQQQQQLRPYYQFLSIDGVRYQVDGEQRMYASAVRELPSRAFVGPKEWLRYWGSAALLFTHGLGLVMSPVNAVDDAGNVLYAAKDVPPVVSDSGLAHEPRIYFGEGLKDDYILTNVRDLPEFDYATEQSRAEVVYPDSLGTGIPVSSWFHRVIFALYTGDYTAFLFSHYIDHARTRVHIRRTPVTRATAVAPFLFLDTNAYAFIADGRVLWMLNGLTTSDRYPYAYREVLGDKSDERAVEPVPERLINYAEDAVKITIDAFTGAIRFYQIADDPIVNSWRLVYPDLFRAREDMPDAVAHQLTYPLQWFHVQFDDIYKRYHQRHPLEFYNVEDLWDDADETLGSLGRGLSGFGTGDQMTFSYEGYQALIDPVDLPASTRADGSDRLRFALLKPFTPEGARNLRALIIAFQDPEDYGRLVSLQVPQGVFVPGPEQVDAYIDNDRPVHQQVTMWIRHASEVIRGRTLLLPVGGDLLYLETVWVNSLQNDLPQLKLFAIRYHDRITSGSSLEEAIRMRDNIPSDPVEGPGASMRVLAGDSVPAGPPPVSGNSRRGGRQR